MKKENDKIIISSEMTNEEIFKKIKDIFSFKDYEKEYFIEFVMSMNFQREKAEVIVDVGQNVWYETDTDLSLDRIISGLCEGVSKNEITIDEISKINKFGILKSVEENYFGHYSTKIYAKIVSISLKDLLKLSLFNSQTIYKLNEKDAQEFIERWIQKKRVPLVKIVSGTIGIDNHNNKLCVEQFETEEMVLKWLDSNLTVEQVNQLFNNLGCIEQDDESKEEDEEFELE